MDVTPYVMPFLPKNPRISLIVDCVGWDLHPILLVKNTSNMRGESPNLS